MAERRRPRWAVMVGGPHDGQRRLLTPNEMSRFRVYTLLAPGVGVAHEYELTSEKISARAWQAQQVAVGNPWARTECGGRVARYVGATAAGHEEGRPSAIQLQERTVHATAWSARSSVGASRGG